MGAVCKVSDDTGNDEKCRLRDYTHYDCEEWVSVGLVVHLRVDVDAAEPAAVAWVRVIPANGVFEAPNLCK